MMIEVHMNLRNPKKEMLLAGDKSKHEVLASKLERYRGTEMEMCVALRE